MRRNDYRFDASKFSVKGVRKDTGKVEHIDILRDQLVSREEVMRQSKKGRALDKNSAYTAIENAHKELKDELEMAAAVVP